MDQLKIISFFENLNLSENQVKICIAVTNSKTATMLQIAKRTGINRTKVYREVEKLIKEGILEEAPNHTTKRVQLTDAEMLKSKLDQKKHEVEELSRSFPELAIYLAANSSIVTMGSRISIYNTPPSVQNMIKDIYKSCEQIYCFAMYPLTDICDDKEMYEWHSELILNQIICKYLFTTDFADSKKDNALTDVLGLKYPNYGKYIQIGKIQKEVLDIKTQVYVCDNSVYYLKKYSGQYIGVKIENQEMADMQKQLFDLVWRQTNEKAAKVIKSFT